MFSTRVQNIFWSIFNSVLMELLKEYDGVFPARWIIMKKKIYECARFTWRKKKHLSLFTGLKLHYYISLNANMLSTNILVLVVCRMFVDVDLV